MVTLPNYCLEYIWIRYTWVWFLYSSFVIFLIYLHYRWYGTYFFKCYIKCFEVLWKWPTLNVYIVNINKSFCYILILSQYNMWFTNKCKKDPFFSLKQCQMVKNKNEHYLQTQFEWMLFKYQAWDPVWKRETMHCIAWNKINFSVWIFFNILEMIFQL